MQLKLLQDEKKRQKVIEIAQKQKERLADLMSVIEERRNLRKKQKV